MKRTLAALLLAGCASAAPKPAEPKPGLEIPKLAPAPTSAPVAVAPSSKPEAWRGSCGDHSVGNPAPPVTYPPPHAGNVVVVYFWATWCAPCRRDFPAFQAIFAPRRDRGLEMVMISVDDEDNHVAEFATNNGYRFPVDWDRDKTNAQCWRIDQMPSVYVVDRRGIIRFVQQGSDAGLADRIAEEIDGLL